MKGISSALVLLLVMIVAVGVGLTVWGVYTVYLAAIAPVVPVDYDGEFDDGFLATKAYFYSDFNESTDCNVTSDVLGGSSYTSCIYRTDDVLKAAYNSTDFVFAWVFDLDGPIEAMDIDIALQDTSGAGQGTDDIVISDCKIYTYEDTPVLVYDLKNYIEDHIEVDATTGPLGLAEDEYVLWIKIHTKVISPEFATGNDLLKIDLDLTTDGDVDAARVLIEAS